MNERLGTPVVDELRLCYTAEPLLLEELSGVEVGGSLTIAPFVLYRIGGDRFEYMFTVCIGDINSREEVATLKYGRYGAASTQYVFFRVSNHVLYDGGKLRLTLSLPEMMGMYFNNFTALDIAVDFKKNIGSPAKFRGRLSRSSRYMCSVPKMSFLLSLLSRDWLSAHTNSKKSRMPSGMKKLRKCPSNCARVDALSIGWPDVVKNRERPTMAGRP